MLWSAMDSSKLRGVWRFEIGKRRFQKGSVGWKGLEIGKISFASLFYVLMLSLFFVPSCQFFYPFIHNTEGFILTETQSNCSTMTSLSRLPRDFIVHFMISSISRELSTQSSGVLRMAFANVLTWHGTTIRDWKSLPKDGKGNVSQYFGVFCVAFPLDVIKFPCLDAFLVLNYRALLNFTVFKLSDKRSLLTFIRLSGFSELR